MTEIELNQYTALKRRIERNQIRYDKIQQKDIPVVSGKVKGSMNEYPFIETHYSVEIYEPKENDNCRRRMNDIENAIQEDLKRVQAIEHFISSIKDVEMQSVFEMRVYEKMKWADIAGELDGDRTTYARKFKKYIEKCT